jgi:tetratricopeptide (TPR) repeat protein
VLDALSGLVDDSLVSAEYAGEEVRYRLHEIVRQYAGERLIASGELTRIHGRHLDFYLRLAEAIEPKLRGGDEAAWLNRLDHEHDNLRAALRWAMDSADQREAALRLAGALWVFWFIRGQYDEGRRCADGALDAARGAAVSASARGRALCTAASFAGIQGDLALARVLSQDSLAACESAGDQFGVAVSLHHLGYMAMQQGDLEQAEDYLGRGLDMARRLQDAWLVDLLINDLGHVARAQGDLARARSLFGECVAVARQSGSKFSLAYDLISLASVVLEQGDHQHAAALDEESLTLFQELGEKRGMAFVLGQLGRIALRAGEHARAEERIRESLGLFYGVGDKASVIDYLVLLASVALAQAESDRASLLLGASDALRRRVGLSTTPGERLEHEAVAMALRARMDPLSFQTAWERGSGMPLEQVVRYALKTHV